MGKQPQHGARYKRANRVQQQPQPQPAQQIAERRGRGRGRARVVIEEPRVEVEVAPRVEIEPRILAQPNIVNPNRRVIIVEPRVEAAPRAGPEIENPRCVDEVLLHPIVEDDLMEHKRMENKSPVRKIVLKKRRREEEKESENKESDNEERDKKKRKVHKIKEIPRFDGASSDDYDRWKQECTYYIKSQKVPVDEQVELIIMGLGGEARKLVAKRKNIKRLEQLFEALEVVYRRSGAEVQNALVTKQALDESVRQFASRFQANWEDAELGSDNDKGIVAWKLRLFMDNIKPEYSKRLKIWAPRTFEDALNAAITYETEAIGTISDCRKEKVNLIDQELTLEKILAIVGQKSANSKTSGDQDKNNRWEKAKCFHCGKSGHGFTRCFKATVEEKEALRARLPEW
jgi:hypothetical protein